MRPPTDITGLNAWIKRYAASSGAAYVDYYSAVVDSSGGRLQALEFGTIRGGAAEVPEQLAALRARLAEAIERHRPQAMAAERLFVTRNQRTAVRVGQASGVALLAAAEAGIPVVEYGPLQVKQAVVGVGNTARPMDAELTRVNMPRRVLVGSRLNIETIVGLSGYGPTKVLLSVREDGRAVKTEEVNLRGNDTQAVNLEITPTTPGIHRYTVEVTPLDGELTVENNKQDSLVEVIEGPLRILHVEGEPRWELGKIRESIQPNEKNVTLVSLQRTGENKFYRQGIENEQMLAEGFPKTKEELYRYKGLIFGSIESTFFTQDQLNMVVDYVSNRGGGFPITTVTRTLLDLKCIELVRTAQRRGAIEHYYKALRRPFFTDRDWKRLPRSGRQAIADLGLQLIWDDVSEAIKAGTLDARPDLHLVRSPYVVDEEGWRELRDALDALLKETERITKRSEKRLAKSNESGISTRLVIMHFESPS